MPTGCSDNELPWVRESSSILDTKYPYVCHAELNSILNSNQMSLQDCTLYATLFPCNECAKAIIQAGIKKVIYYEDKYVGTESNTASKRLLDLSKVLYLPYTLCDLDIILKL